MVFVPAKSICILKRYSYLLLFAVACLCLLSGCTAAQNKRAVFEENAARADRYNTDSLAKEWRKNVRENPHNPYESSGYRDNDWEYRHPKKRTRTSQPYQDNDSTYMRYPRYNPDDDNTYLDPEHYPLYLDY